MTTVRGAAIVGALLLPGDFFRATTNTDNDDKDNDDNNGGWGGDRGGGGGGWHGIPVPEQAVVGRGGAPLPGKGDGQARWQ
jgi:hypothetical protein